MHYIFFLLYNTKRQDSSANRYSLCRKKIKLTKFSIRTGYGRDVVIVARNSTVNFTCTDGIYNPTWFVNESTVGTEGRDYRTIIEGTEEVTATLTINGNIICDTLNIHCEAYVSEEGQYLSMHNTSVKVQGELQ